MRNLSVAGLLKILIEGPMNSLSTVSKRTIILICLLVASALFLSGRAEAQQATAQLGGKITDPSGAVIVGAEVTLRNSQTGINRKTTSNKEGEYRFTLIPIGKYEIAVRQQSFQTYEQKGITLDINQNAKV